MPEESRRSRRSDRKRASSSPDSSRSSSSERSVSRRRAVSSSPSGAKSPPSRPEKTSRGKSRERTRRSKRSSSREKKHSKSSRRERSRRDSPERRPPARRDPFTGDKSRLYVGDLLPHLGEEDLRVLFAPHGELVEVSLQMKPQDNGLNFGFVQFRTAEQAARALRHLKDVTIDNQPLKIELARPKKRDLEREQQQQLPPARRPTTFDAQQQMMAMSQMWPGFAAMQGMANWAQAQLDQKPKYAARSRSRDRRRDDRGVQIEVMAEGGKRTVHRGDNSPGRKKATEEPDRWRPGDKGAAKRSRSRSPDKKKTKRSKSRSESPPGSVECKVTISNLSRKITADELKTKLERFGKIRKLDVHQDENSRGVANVTFAEEEGAALVLKEDAIFINNKRLEIQPWKPQVRSHSEPEQDDEDVVPNRLHVRNLAYSTSPKGLKSYFKQFGDVEEAWVVDDPKTGKSKGVGFVEFKSQEGAARAMKEEVHELDGRTIHPHYAKLSAEFNTGQGLSATRLHLSNLPSSVSQSEVRKYFAKYGHVTDLYLVPDKKTPGVGFVEFSTHKEAATCIRVPRHTIGDNKISVEYAKLRVGEGGLPVPAASAFPSIFNTPMPFPSMPFFPSMMTNPFLFPPRLAGGGMAGMPFPFPVPAPASRSGRPARGRGPKT